MKKKLNLNIKISPREKFLLMLLLVTAVGVFGYLKIWIPQQDKMIALEAEQADYQAKIDENNAILGKEAVINKEWEELKLEQARISQDYLHELDQPKLIYRMNEILTKDNIAFPQYSFTQASTEQINEFDVQNMGVSVPFEGTYQGMIEAMTSINENPQKFLIERVSINSKPEDTEGVITGNMNLKFYSLDGIIAKSESGEEEVVIPAVTAAASSDTEGVDKVEVSKTADSLATVDTPVVTQGEIPFVPFKSYSDQKAIEKAVVGEDGKIEMEPFIETTVMNFDKGNYYFLPSHDLIKGNVVFSNKAKNGKSLRLEYDIVAVEAKNRAYIDISKNGIELKFPPDSLGLWVYSYDYLPITIGMEFEGQLGEKFDVPFTQGLGWTGWKYLNLTPPVEVANYPLALNRLYVEMPKGRDGSGVVLLDDLQTVFARNVDEDGNDMGVEPYVSYVVKFGDTFRSISYSNYGSERFANEIKNFNEIYSDDKLTPGRVIILKRR